MPRPRPLLLGLLGGLIGGLIAGAVVVFIQDRPKIKLGNVAEWIAGLGTTGAIAFSGMALRNEIKQRLADEKRLAVAEAQSVRFLLPHTNSAQEEQGLDGVTRLYLRGDAVTENRSRGRLSDVDVRLFFGDTEIEKWRLGNMAPEARHSVPFKKEWIVGTQPPGSQWAEVQFTDPTGIRWAKADDGSLTELGRDRQ